MMAAHPGHGQPQDDVTKRVVANMKQLRRERKLSQGELAMELNLRRVTAINKTVIVNLENERRADMTVSELAAIAALFGVSIEWLVTSHGPKCLWCKDCPPSGYRCQTCLAEGDLQ